MQLRFDRLYENRNSDKLARYLTVAPFKPWLVGAVENCMPFCTPD